MSELQIAIGQVVGMIIGMFIVMGYIKFWYWRDKKK